MMKKKDALRDMRALIGELAEFGPAGEQKKAMHFRLSCWLGISERRVRGYIGGEENIAVGLHEGVNAVRALEKARAEHRAVLREKFETLERQEKEYATDLQAFRRKYPVLGRLLPDVHSGELAADEADFPSLPRLGRRQPARVKS